MRVRFGVMSGVVRNIAEGDDGLEGYYYRVYQGKGLLLSKVHLSSTGISLWLLKIQKEGLLGQIRLPWWKISFKLSLQQQLELQVVFHQFFVVFQEIKGIPPSCSVCHSSVLHHVLVQ